MLVKDKYKMKICVLQIEDRNDTFINKLMKSNESICKSNDIEYKFLKKSSEHVPPYWGKIKEIKKILDTHSEFDYVFWVDSDAFFINFNKERLLKFLEKYNSYSFICTKDMPPWSGNFNAGVFIVKNNEIGKSILDKWLSYYHENVWSYDNDTQKWSTTAVWAGEEYEQGSFSKFIINDPAFMNDIISLPYYYLNNNNCEDHQDETLLVHLAGEHKTNETTKNGCKKLIINDDKIIEEFYSSDENKIYDKLLTILLIFLFILILILLGYYIYEFYCKNNGVLDIKKLKK